MSKDLFDGGAPIINGKHYDLFSGAPVDAFRWVVAMFSQDGASQIIQRANAIPLATFYPIKWDRHGDPVPLWQNYLFLEFKEAVTIDLCRTTTKFVKIIS